MSGTFAADFVSQAVSKVLVQTGYDRVQGTACSVLADVFIRFLTAAATRAHGYSEEQGRTIANMEDAARALEELGVEPDSLGDFCRTWCTAVPEKRANGTGILHSSASAATAAVEKESEWEPGAFPLNLDELLHPPRVEGDEPFLESVSDSPSHVPHRHPSPPSLALVPNADPHVTFPSQSDAPDEEEVIASLRPPAKKKAVPYGTLITTQTEKHFTSDWPTPPVEKHPSKVSPPSLRIRNSTASFSAAVQGLQRHPPSQSQKTAQLLSKSIVPILQQRKRKMQAVPDPTMFGTEKGILDDLLGVALPRLPGLLEGQRPVRRKDSVSGSSGGNKRRKTIHGENVPTTVSSSLSPSTSLAPSIPEPPKIKLKFNLASSPPPPPPPPSILVGHNLPSSTTSHQKASPQHAVWTAADIVNCVCDHPSVDTGGFMIACDKCGVWYHGKCVGIPSEEQQGPGDWFCGRCRNR
ncbi:hypothetical protein HKX48_001944 [Thoreauomyces humboldtii]|nr:hypothetical protein HKX48_001944 [Thoreauomyces humboldtii]